MPVPSIDPTGIATGVLGTVTGSVGGSVADSAFKAIANDFAGAAESAVNWLWGQISASTSVTFGGAGYDRDIGAITALAGVVIFFLFVIQVITAMLRRDGTGLLRALRGMLIATCGAILAIAVVDILLTASDQLSAGIVQVGGYGSIQSMGGQLVAATTLTSIADPAVMFVGSIAVLAAVIIVWAALMVRKLLLIITAIFAPLAFAGAAADITRHWVTKWIETMLALIFSKVILVMIFVIGLDVLSGTIGAKGTGVGQGTTQLAVGILILLLAGLAPWVALKLVHFTGGHFEQLHAQSGVATQGASQAVAAPQKANASYQKVSSAMGGGSPGSSGGVTGTGKATASPGMAGVGSNGTAATGGAGGAAVGGAGATGGGGQAAAGAGGGAAAAGGPVVAGAIAATSVGAAVRNSAVRTVESARSASKPTPSAGSSAPAKSPTPPETAPRSTPLPPPPPTTPPKTA